MSQTPQPPTVAGPSGTGPQPPPALDRHLLDYVRILVKRRWTALAGLLVVIGGAAVHAYTAVPIYEAVVQLLIEPEDQNAFSLHDTAVTRQTADYYDTQYTILQSRTVARRAVERLGAWDSPELTGRTVPASLRPTGPVEGVLQGLGTWWTRLRGADAQPESRAGPEGTGAEATGGTPRPPLVGDGGIESPGEARVVDAFVSRLSVVPVKNSRLVDVKFRAADPMFAAQAANALARAYMEQNLETRLTASKETTDWLTEQLAEQRRRIEVSEAALQRYRETNDAGSLSDRQNIVVQKLSDLNAIVTRAKADRIQKESLYRQVLAIQESEASLDTFPTIHASPFLQQLRTELAQLQARRSELAGQLGERHPEMVAVRTAIQGAELKLQRELETQVEAIRNEYQAALSLETELAAALEAQKREAQELDRKEIDYSVLEREVASNRQIFDSLLQRTREKGIAGELRTSDVRIVDAAQPPRAPVWPTRLQMLLYGLFFGSLLGTGLAFFLEYLDDRIKAPDEIKMYLGLPCLGLVPATGNSRGKNAAIPLLDGKVPPLFAEAFRTVRTNIFFSGLGSGRSVVVTSTGAGEGKTVVSSNLAVSLAMTGQRVLLLDVDLRRPRVHEAFGVAQAPGLAELLAGSATTEQVVRQGSVPHLSLLPSGQVPGNPAELLSSPAFVRVLEELTGAFDWVVVDSPPVAAVSDAAIVANRASAVLFVVGAESTRRSAAVHAIDQLQAASATFLGAVLNRVKLRRNAYYYSSYYRPEYEQYHTGGRPVAAAGG